VQECRKFYRHPSEIPVELWEVSDPAYTHPSLKNVSMGGLAFICTNYWPPNTLIKLRLALVKPAFEAVVKVVWARRRLSYFEIGVMFISEEDAFKGRMVEQLCQIELYRQKQLALGRLLTCEEAALEWVEQYAERFDKNMLHYAQNQPLH